MSMNEAETRFHLIDPVLRGKGYNDHQWIKMETPAPVEPTGPKGRRRKGAGRTDYLLCVQVGDMPKALPVGVLEAKKESDDPLKGMQQAKGYADCKRFDVKYVFFTRPNWPSSPLGEQCILSLARGAVSERMLFNRLADGEIELPDFTIQQKASSALAVFKPMRQVMESKINGINLLPQKILAQAFEM